MTNNPQELIGFALDDVLSDAEFVEFHHWLKSSPDHVKQFAEAALLHDRLRGELLAMPTRGSELLASNLPQNETKWLRRVVNPFAFGGVALAAVMALIVTWFGLGGNTVSAATELKRLITVQQQSGDRTWQIDVEQIGIAKGAVDEANRPPKPPLDRAILHVRRKNQFVLIRRTSDGRNFVTGSNGRMSWAVAPNGPVRTSNDLTRFNRDLPGHEHQMPLSSIEDGLAQLQASYDIELLPVEVADESPADEESRLLVAVKKRGVRGPRRVEITYLVHSGLIQQLRFIEMPYGPQRLTLRMTSLEDRAPDEMFFHHESHHDAGREVIEE